MSSFEGQSTDAENSRALHKSKNAGDDLKQVKSASAQAIAHDRANQNTVGGSGAQNPGANVQAGK